MYPAVSLSGSFAFVCSSNNSNSLHFHNISTPFGSFKKWFGRRFSQVPLAETYYNHLAQKCKSKFAQNALQIANCYHFVIKPTQFFTISLVQGHSAANLFCPQKQPKTKPPAPHGAQAAKGLFSVRNLSSGEPQRQRR